MKTLALLTSGGDAPGMNPCVRAVVRTALSHGLVVKAIRRGFEGLVSGEFVEMGARDVGSILQKGGTILMTGRFPEFAEMKYQRLALRKLNEASVDALVVIGGEGSMHGALALHNLGFPVVGLPASIDNDVHGTQMSIGVDTALNTIIEAIDKLRDTASSHQRAFVIETMGRECGYLALMAGIIGGAEEVLIPEQDTSPEEVAAAISDAYVRRKTHAIIVVAEGAHLHASALVEQLDAMNTGFQFRVTILGHIQRGAAQRVRPAAGDAFRGGGGGAVAGGRKRGDGRAEGPRDRDDAVSRGVRQQAPRESGVLPHGADARQVKRGRPRALSGPGRRDHRLMGRARSSLRRTRTGWGRRAAG